MTWWVSLIAGAYTALCITMWATAIVYAGKSWRQRKTQDIATLVLMSGISLTFTGHALDQSLWTTSNIHRAVNDTAQASLSAWYALHIPFVVVLGKYIASAGAFLHLWVAFHRDRSIRRMFFLYSLTWAVIMTAVATAVH